MRKQTLLFFAGAMLVMASCNTTNQDTTADQATIDSMVNARVEELREQMMLENDSLINELAWMRADSIINAANGKASSTTRTPPRRTTPVRNNNNSEPTKTPVADPQKTRNNQNTSATDQKSLNNDAPKTVDEQKRRNNQ